MSRNVFITGGTRGIGAAIAKRMLKSGYRVAASFAGNQEAASAFEEETGIRTFKWSVADYTACGEGLQEAEAAIGAIDILVNNAGITRDGMFHRLTPEKWHQVIETNLNGVFNMTHHVWPGMRERRFGRIINISSVNGQKGQMGQTNYAAAKAGEIGFTKALAQEGARVGITVNAICPGYIGTEMVMAVPEKTREAIIAQIPVGRLGEAEEIARCVEFLASEDAGFITGSTLSANGGQYMV